MSGIGGKSTRFINQNYGYEYSLRNYHKYTPEMIKRNRLPDITITRVSQTGKNSMFAQGAMGGVNGGMGYGKCTQGYSNHSAWKPIGKVDGHFLHSTTEQLAYSQLYPSFIGGTYNDGKPSNTIGGLYSYVTEWNGELFACKGIDAVDGQITPNVLTNYNNHQDLHWYHEMGPLGSVTETRVYRDEVELPDRYVPAQPGILDITKAPIFVP
jgi:hypothetical protein